MLEHNRVVTSIVVLTESSLKLRHGWLITFHMIDAMTPPCSVDMMTSSNGNIFRVTGPLCGEFTGPGEFPAQRPVTRSFDVFFDLRLNKRLSKQSRGWWFETPSWSLWRHCNAALGLHLNQYWLYHEQKSIHQKLSQNPIVFIIKIAHIAYRNRTWQV